MLFGMDCLFILNSFILTFLLGLPFVYLIQDVHFRNKYLISPIFGYGVMGMLATIAYRHGITHHHLYQYLWAAAILIVLTSIYKKIINTRRVSECFAEYKYPLLIWLCAFIIILLPYWLAGEQFSVYQGWIHDQFSYLGTALTYSHESFKEVNQSSGEFFIRSPTAMFGALELYRRPGIEHILGMLSEVQLHEMYRFGYLLLAMMVANGMFAAIFLITNFFNTSTLRATLVAAAIFLGFWGQLYIDFNAWSMTGAMPILLVVTTYVMVAARNIKGNTPLSVKHLLPLSFLIAFALYIYPENMIFHIPGLLAVLVLVSTVGFRLPLTKDTLIPTGKVVFAILLGFSASLFYFQGTIGHFIWAAGFSAQNVMTQAVYGDYLQPIFGQANWFRPLFLAAVDYSNHTVNVENQTVVLTYILNQVFVSGHYQLIYYTIVDGLYGFFGMYFLTPMESFSPVVQEVWRGVLTFGLLLFVWFNYKSYVDAFKKYRSLFIFIGVLASMLLFFLLMTRVYAMARGLYFIAPYCMILFFIPLLVSKKLFTVRNSFFIFVLFTQLGFGLARIPYSILSNPFYPMPYTMAKTHYFLEGKTNYDWDMARFDKTLKQCHRVFVDVPNGWHQYGVTLYLYSKGKQFVKSIPVKTSFWAADYIGYQQVNGKEDCTFIVKKATLANSTEFNQLELLTSAPVHVPKDNHEKPKKA